MGIFDNSCDCKHEIESLRSQISYLSSRVYALEYPQKFNVGNKVIYTIHPCGGDPIIQEGVIAQAHSEKEPTGVLFWKYLVLFEHYNKWIYQHELELNTK